MGVHDYKKDNDQNKLLATNYIPRIDYRKKGINQNEQRYENASLRRNDRTDRTSFRNNSVFDNECTRLPTTKTRCTKHRITSSDASSLNGDNKIFHPPTKMFKMTSNVNSKDGERLSDGDYDQPLSTAIGCQQQAQYCRGHLHFSDLDYNQPSTSAHGHHSNR